MMPAAKRSMTWRQSRPIWIALGVIAVPILAAIFFLAQLPPGEPLPERESEAAELTMTEFQVSSKMKLEQALRDPDSARYENVRAYLLSEGTERENYAFCGRLNSKNGFGGYSGWKRFIANPLIVAVEDGSEGFTQLWAGYCEKGIDKGEVWF